MSLYTETWGGARRELRVGDAVLVKSWGYGARLQDVGRRGTVARVNVSRVVVAFGGYEGGERAIAPACLRHAANPKEEQR